MRPLLPMLATPAAPFDSEEYLFEVKWDGVRALAGIEVGRWRLWGRTGTDYTARYPELAVLGGLPAGTVVDGELVVLQGGRADFPALLRRHQRRHVNPFAMAAFQQRWPVSYVLFDLLFDRGRCLVQEALVQRRARLRQLLLALDEPALAYSDGVMGCGREFFARVVAQGHEGVLAKHQASR
jgi:bifunctional non-homologous end joining protein LigD